MFGNNGLPYTLPAVTSAISLRGNHDRQSGSLYIYPTYSEYIYDSCFPFSSCLIYLLSVKSHCLHIITPFFICYIDKRHQIYWPCMQLLYIFHVYNFHKFCIIHPFFIISCYTYSTGLSYWLVYIWSAQSCDNY